MEITFRARMACLSLLFLLLPLTQAQEGPHGLYGQAASAMLDRSFPSAKIEYLLLDAQSKQTIALRWPHSETPVPVGSLLKPFVALAYGQLHSGSASSESLLLGKFPVVHCHGRSDGCWRAGGHGSLGLERALAESCNAYFLALARDISASSSGVDAIDRVSTSYGLPAPPRPGSNANFSGPGASRMMIGVTPDWRISPMALADAYATLATQSNSETVNLVLTGMKMAAWPGGTAARIGRHPGGVLAKTGTAPCVQGPERCIANGDGLVVVLAPAENPRLLLLVRQRGTTGAQTAEVAGRMLARLEDAYVPVR
jgi:cell division protein FtsI/penicillin-binding protein 2